MEVATTHQFRKAVRKIAAKKGLTIYDSYTNGAPRRGYKESRTVGFSMEGATPELAAKIEKKLNKKGLTAKTRHTNSGHMSVSGVVMYGGCNYIRGTCVIA